MLPGGSGCGVLVTSRRPLAGLEGARLVDLDVFDMGKALELLSRIVGRARVAAEQAAATRILNRCGRLPLAVRIAGLGSWPSPTGRWPTLPPGWRMNAAVWTSLPPGTWRYGPAFG